MNKPLMNTHEVAEYLRIKERKVYDLVSQRQIPCTRAAGKWLFPKDLIDLWLLHNAEGVPRNLVRTEPPMIVSGSHDPLLDWAVRESGSGLAVLFNGSLDGLERFAHNHALACGLHVLDSGSGDYNTPLIEQRLATEPVVLIEWAHRQQGLMVAPGNPLGIKNLTDVAGKRVALRQKEAGSFVLLEHLLREQNLSLADVASNQPPMRSETEVALAVSSGQADAALGIAAAADQMQLSFVPLIEERYDLLLWRRQYFEPPLQALLAFCQSDVFTKRAAELVGYDVSDFGSVRYNAA